MYVAENQRQRIFREHPENRRTNGNKPGTKDSETEKKGCKAKSEAEGLGTWLATLPSHSVSSIQSPNLPE